MILSGALKRNVAMLAVTFIVCSFLNVVFEGIGFIDCSRLYCCVLVLIWALSIQERVIDVRLRNILLLIAVQILLCALLQMFRDNFFSGNFVVQRYMWYIHYAPMMVIALLCFYLSLYIYRPEEKPVSVLCRLPAGIGTLFIFGILTNDLHFSAFRFSDNRVPDDVQRSRAWLIYLFMIFVFLTVFAACFVILKKHQRYCLKKHCLMPLVPVLIEVAYMVLYVRNMDPQINGVHLWDYGEIFCICTIAFLETCIQVGMIPANKDYDKLFAATSYPAVILDKDGNVVYKTAGAQVPFPANEDVQVNRHQILGGSIEWTVDVKYTRMLNRELLEATQQLATRNAYLAEENRIKKEKAELRLRNRLYDGITRIVQRQISLIDELLNDKERPLDVKLPKIAVLKAYIKRRSNMGILAVSGPLPQGELTAAITETLEYVELCGAQTALLSSGTGDYPADMVISAYERFEEVIEHCLDTLSCINVSVRAEENRLNIRIMLEAGGFSYGPEELVQEGKDFTFDSTVTKDGKDVNIALTFEKGGKSI